MKKFFLTLLIILLFSASGWAEDQQTSDTTPESDITTNETAESTPETSATSPETEMDTQADTDQTDEENTPEATEIDKEEPSHSFGHKLLWYIPNRILDVFDFARVRVRVGPGIALGARVTKPISFFFGGYGTVFVGLPGPRLEPTVKLPIGLENYGGLSVSLLDSTNDGRFAPNYSPTEIGVSLHFLIPGFDVGVDPVEVIDLALGFIFIDIRGDDF